jgi:hypothetical protein
MSASDTNTKVVWGIVTRGAETSWLKVGIAWEGPNGSMFARLDSLPISGVLCIGEPGQVSFASEDPDVSFSASGPCAYVPMAAERIS